MKKFLCSFLLLAFIFCPAYSMNEEIINNLPDDPSLEKQIEYIYPKLQQAHKNNDLEELYNISVEGYNIKKTGNFSNIKLVNDMFSAFAIKYSVDRYQLTKEEKYLKRAFKWSKISVNDKTSQVYSVESDILLASIYGDLNEMKKAYDLYRSIDIEKANKVYQEYDNLLNNVIAYKKEKTQAKKDNVKKGVKILLNGIATGASSYGNSMQNHSKSTSTYCNTIGNTLHCTSY